MVLAVVRVTPRDDIDLDEFRRMIIRSVEIVYRSLCSITCSLRFGDHLVGDEKGGA